MIDVGRDLDRMRDYVGGRLSDDEHRAFEDRLARDPELVRELELSLRLREGLERLRSRGYLDALLHPIRRRAWAWTAGLAAAAVAGVALLLWLQPAARPRAVLTADLSAGAGTTSAREAVVARFTFVGLRGASAAPVLELPPAGVIELRAAPAGPSSGAHYRLTLERRDAGLARTEVGALTGLAAGPDGLVRSYAEASRLRPGDYTLRVEAEDEPASSGGAYLFSLRSVRR